MGTYGKFSGSIEFAHKNLKEIFLLGWATKDEWIITHTENGFQFEGEDYWKMPRTSTAEGLLGWCSFGSVLLPNDNLHKFCTHFELSALSQEYLLDNEEFDYTEFFNNNPIPVEQQNKLIAMTNLNNESREDFVPLESWKDFVESEDLFDFIMDLGLDWGTWFYEDGEDYLWWWGSHVSLEDDELVCYEDEGGVDPDWVAAYTKDLIDWINEL